MKMNSEEKFIKKITGKCLQDFSDNFKQSREVCKVFMSNISLISLFFQPIFLFKVIHNKANICLLDF